MLAFHLFFYILICQSVVIISPHKYSFKNAWLQLVNPQYLCDVNDHCFITDVEKSHSGFFSTKTAYRFAKRPNSDDEYYIPNCTPSKLWLLVRHGTRLPGAKKIKAFRNMEKFREKIVENQKLTGIRKLCESDLELLQQWNLDPSITEDKAYYLTSEGYNELRSIANKYQRLFPHLIDRSYDPNQFHFQHTNFERTKSSFRAFVDELFDENEFENINVEQSANPDLLLKAYAYCSAWKQRKKIIKSPGSEMYKFQQSNSILRLIDEVSSLLGFPKTLSLDEINRIYDLCRYETSFYVNKTSVWCKIFTPDQIRLFEYREDLIYYYKSSHGNEENKYVQKELVADFQEKLDMHHKVTAYFAHSATVQLFLTALNVHRDKEAPTASNFLKMSNRNWKTSRISPFAANVAIVRYKCPGSDKVKFFLNERLLKFDWCSEDGSCKWEDVKSEYSNDTFARFYCS